MNDFSERMPWIMTEFHAPRICLNSCELFKDAKKIPFPVYGYGNENGLFFRNQTELVYRNSSGCLMTYFTCLWNFMRLNITCIQFLCCCFLPFWFVFSKHCVIRCTNTIISEISKMISSVLMWFHPCWFKVISICIHSIKSIVENKLKAKGTFKQSRDECECVRFADAKSK